MKLFLSFLLLVFVILADSCKKGCNYPKYQSGNVCYPQIGFKYIGDYHGSDSTSVGSQNLDHEVLVGTKYVNSIEITGIALDAELDEQDHFVIDTQPVTINQLGFMVYGSGYFIDTLNNEMLVANVYFQADTTGNSSGVHFVGLR